MEIYVIDSEYGPTVPVLENYFIFRRGGGGISVLILFYFRLAALGALADVPGPQVPVPDLREA